MQREICKTKINPRWFPLKGTSTTKSTCTKQSFCFSWYLSRSWIRIKFDRFWQVFKRQVKTDEVAKINKTITWEILHTTERSFIFLKSKTNSFLAFYELKRLNVRLTKHTVIKEIQSTGDFKNNKKKKMEIDFKKENDVNLHQFISSIW